MTNVRIYYIGAATALVSVWGFVKFLLKKEEESDICLSHFENSNEACGYLGIFRSRSL